MQQVGTAAPIASDWVSREPIDRLDGVQEVFDWSSPPGVKRQRFSARLAAALQRQRELATIDMDSRSIARETGCR